MHKDVFSKRVLDTTTEIFPLDRMLPLNSVYTVFLEQYGQHKNKEIFFKQKRFQRLREGYFSLFVALSLNDLRKKEHFMVFPKDASNDVYILEKPQEVDKLRDRAVTYTFDIKEYTKFSISFRDFVQKSIIPNIGIYNLIISTYKDIGEEEINDLVDLIPNEYSKVWIVGASSPEDENDHAGRVFILSKEGTIYAEDIRLAEHLKRIDPIVVYQDQINIKQK